MKFSTLKRKARVAIKTQPEFRKLEREKRSVANGLSNGKYSGPQAKALLRLTRLRREILYLRALYGLMRSGVSA